MTTILNESAYTYNSRSIITEGIADYYYKG